MAPGHSSYRLFLGSVEGTPKDCVYFTKSPITKKAKSPSVFHYVCDILCLLKVDTNDKLLSYFPAR